MPPIKASEFNGDLSGFLLQYEYQPELTKKLDDLDVARLTPELLNEIFLWKVNRYVSLDRERFQRIDALRKLKAGEHGQGRCVLEELLDIRGVDLPMASTILRFRNHAAFQIIDRHAYRALYGRKYPLFPSTRDGRLMFTSVTLTTLTFETVDRVRYVFDKKTNGSLGESEE